MASAKKRHEANELFKSKNYAEAISGYTQSIEMYSTDPVVWSNRAAAELQLLPSKVEETASASTQSDAVRRVVEDAAHAAALIFVQNGLPRIGHASEQRGGLLIKCLYRRASALSRLGKHSIADAVAFHSATVALAQSLGEKAKMKTLADTVLALWHDDMLIDSEEGKLHAVSATRAVLARLQTAEFVEGCFHTRPNMAIFAPTSPTAPVPFRIDSSRRSRVPSLHQPTI
jgi:hypothetical protein